jgi:hypothetical protein
MVARTTVAGCLADAGTRDKLRQLTRPNSISKTLRKAGLALMLSPDPITDVPGAIMLGVSFATRGRDPLSPASVYIETRKLLAEIGGLV